MNHTVDGPWREHRAYLVNLAYQITGDVGAAEDVVQEAFLRLSRNPSGPDDVRGWLTVVTSRLCLDHLRSARVRREAPSTTSVESASPELGPADRVTLDDDVHAALLMVLQRLSPAERVAFILHDIFAVPFDVIAEMVGRSAGTVRQSARRARLKISDAAPGPHSVAAQQHGLVTERFITACATGDIDALAAVLDPDVWGSGTLLGTHEPPMVNHGRSDVARNLLLYLGPGSTLVSIPGRPVVFGYSRRRLFAVVVLTVRDGLVRSIEATADPAARQGEKMSE